MSALPMVSWNGAVDTEKQVVKVLQRRLASLERALRPASVLPAISAVALRTGGDDLVAIDGAWVPCPVIATVLARKHAPLKVYGGFDPREV
jgi:hypothetical protein